MIIVFEFPPEKVQETQNLNNRAAKPDKRRNTNGCPSLSYRVAKASPKTVDRGVGWQGTIGANELARTRASGLKVPLVPYTWSPPVRWPRG